MLFVDSNYKSLLLITVCCDRVIVAKLLLRNSVCAGPGLQLEPDVRVFRTGDLGYLSQEHGLHVTGRKGLLVKVNGAS